MVSTETWMGSGQSVTLAPESELFLGYMNLGPTLGMANTNKAHLIKYSVGYALDGTAVTVGTTKLFSDYYELVPDLYTGCTAEFYYSDFEASAATLRFSAVVAGNDTDAIYFSGNVLDYPSLFNKDTNATVANPRGYIILKANGSVIPAPISLELIDGAVTSMTTKDVVIAAVTGNAQKFNMGDIIRNASGVEIGRVYSGGADATLLTYAGQPVKPTSAHTHIHLISDKLAGITSHSEASVTISTIVTDANLVGEVSAGDYITTHASDPTHTDAHTIGRVMTTSATSIKVACIDGTTLPADSEELYWGARMLLAGNGTTVIHRTSPRILSNNWLGLTNTVGIPTVEVETKQTNLSLAGSRNFSYQYRGIETAGSASLDVNLNHGSWLYYAFGNLASVSASRGADKTHTNAFESVDTAATHLLFKGVTTGTDNDFNSTGHTSSNGKFHRQLKGTTALCPPLLPFTSAHLVTLPNDTGTGINNAITYTFAERNDNSLPSFALELLTQKGSKVDGTDKTLMVDRNTYSESVYAQIYPGCVVSDMTLTANENEELKASLNMNVKRVFETEGGYVGKCYDATNNDTSEFKNLLNFGQQTGRGTGSNSDITQSFIDPFFFSNGSISLFGQELLKVSSFTMNLNNTLTDKRYVGQYNTQIKDYIPGQRTYEISIQAMVTDRRLFDELRKLSPHRFTLGELDDGTNAKISLSFTKSNGESINLEFDDYMIGSATWPLQDDRGPVMVDFTIMPLRTGTLNAVTHWVMQS
jgi:hypothetical protein